MKNRILLISLVLLLATSVVATGCPPPPAVEPEVLPWPGYPGPEFKWVGQTLWPAGIHTQVMVEGWARRVGEITGGRLQITMHPVGALMPAMDVFPGVTKGMLDVAHSWPPVWMGMDRAFVLMEPATAGMTIYETVVWLFEFGGWELMKELYGRFNIFPLPGTVGTAEPFLWSTKPIHTLENLEGLKLRSAGLSIDIFKALGAAPVWMPGGEIVPALEKGVIDAAEFSRLFDDVPMGFYLIAPYLIIGKDRTPSNMLELMINLDSWKALPEDLQEAVMAAARETYLLAWASTEMLNAQLLKYIKDFGTEIIHLDEEALAEVRRVRDEILDAFAAKCEFFAKVLSSQREFLELYRPFTEVFWSP